MWRISVKTIQPSSTRVFLDVLMILTTNDVPSSQDIVLFLWMHFWVRWAALCKEKSCSLMVMQTAWWRWIAIVLSSIPEARKGGMTTYWHGSSRMTHIKSALVALMDNKHVSCEAVEYIKHLPSWKDRPKYRQSRWWIYEQIAVASTNDL